MFAWIVVLVGLATVYDASSQNVDDRLNFIEPKFDLWSIFQKPLKGKPNWKSVIASLYKTHTANKLTRHSQGNSPPADSTTWTPSASTESVKSSSDYPSRGKLVDSLLDSLDKDEPPVFHSALDGWVF